ncbi:MAG: universal stress protein [Rhodospirillales bacterium]|nr:universal stress protein [Rhodospirillales bacterium]
MAYKDIVVHLGRDKRSPTRLDAAIALAERHQGRVTGVYVLPDLLYQEYASFRIPPNILRELDVRQRNSAAEVERAFSERIAQTSVQGEWRLMTGDPVDAVTTIARFADITIVGQTHDEDDDNVGALADGVVLAAGGPVLVWPYTGSFGISPETVTVAWNGSREAKRALTDALPLLQQASKVIVFGIDTGDSKRIPGADVSTHLTRHGVSVGVQNTVGSSDIDIANILLSALSDQGAELLVMGAYGHHRLQELLLGGVTLLVLREMTVPVLMSH